MSKSTVEELEQNPELSKLVQDNRISLINAVEDLALVLVDQIVEDNKPENVPEGFDAILDLDSALEQFKVISMSDLSPEEVEQRINELKNQGVDVNVVEVNDAVERLIGDHHRQARKVDFLFICDV